MCNINIAFLSYIFNNIYLSFSKEYINKKIKVTEVEYELNRRECVA